MPNETIDKALFEPKKVLGFRCLDESVSSASSSGGAFALMALEVLRHGGAVCGAAYNDDGSVRHEFVEEERDLCRLQGSKYVRSDVGGTYGECLERIERGCPVLYSGTPCQIHGLRAFLDRRKATEAARSNLCCVDLICHGTPSPDLFKLYLRWLAKMHGAESDIRGYVFRDKSVRWGLYCYRYRYRRDGKEHEVKGEAPYDPYYAAFLKGHIYRSCCYDCPFAQRKRAGDLTIGDFWGIEQHHPEFYDKRGVSAVLINTDAGEKAIERLDDSSYVSILSDFEKVSAGNHNLERPTPRSREDERLAERVRDAVRRGDESEIFDHLLKVSLSPKLKLRKLLPANLRGFYQHFHNTVQSIWRKND